jgi:hypothetical protein
MRKPDLRVLALSTFSTLFATLAHATTADNVVYARMTERLTVVVAGVLSLWMGYRLFQTLGEKRRQALLSAREFGKHDDGADKSQRNRFEATVGNLATVKMSDVGPGIFFALFGSCLLAYVLYSAIDLPPSAGGGRYEINVPTATNRDRAVEIVRSIRIVDSVAAENPRSEAGAQHLAAAIATLKASIPDIIDAGYGTGSYSRYQQLRILRVTNKPEFDQQVTADKDFQDIDKLLTEGP